MDVQEPVRHLVDRRFGRFNLVLDGIVHVAVDELSHAAVEGGREQHRLMLGLDAVQQLLHLGHEAEVGHAVSLVHDEDLDRAQRELAPFEEVDEAAGRADHGVDALSEGGDLPVHRRAAVDGRDAYAAHLAQGREHVLDLVGELTGRREHERPRRLRLRPPDSLEQRKAERERLPRAGLGLAAEVAAGQGIGDRERLDREGFGDAVARERVDEIGSNAECFERG